MFPLGQEFIAVWRPVKRRSYKLVFLRAGSHPKVRFLNQTNARMTLCFSFPSGQVWFTKAKAMWWKCRWIIGHTVGRSEDNKPLQISTSLSYIMEHHQVHVCLECISADFRGIWTARKTAGIKSFYNAGISRNTLCHQTVLSQIIPRFVCICHTKWTSEVCGPQLQTSKYHEVAHCK